MEVKKFGPKNRASRAIKKDSLKTAASLTKCNKVRITILPILFQDLTHNQFAIYVYKIMMRWYHGRFYSPVRPLPHIGAI